ncbi:MAG: amidohydrolase [Myxococcales bacterium]|nr:amidohydrolase [Myxococcales bacterium]
MEHAFDILDVHHHVGDAFAALGGHVSSEGDSTAAKAGRSALPPDRGSEDFGDEMTARLSIMDAGGVRQAIIIPGHGYLRPNGHADTRVMNDGVAAYRDRLPARFPAAVGIVEPRDGPKSFDELARMKNELGLVGVSFHTRFQGVSLDSQWIRQYVERMGELGLVPVIHAMDESTEEALWKLTSLARDFSDLEMLVLDAFGSYESTRQCSLVAELAPALLFDTSLSYNFDFIEQFAQRFGPERVVFGTDLYSVPVGRRISHLLPQILESDLGDDAKSLILGGNARRLFGLA